MHGEIRKRLNDGLSVSESVQAEQAQEDAHDNTEDSRAPEK